MKLKKSRNLLAAVAALCLAAPASAQKSAAVDWLIAEPMSLFDWGVHRTDDKVKGLVQSPLVDGAFGGGARYEVSEGRLKIHMMFIGEPSQAKCKEKLFLAKGAIVGYKWTHAEQVEAAPRIFADLFSHAGGYKAAGRPDNIGFELARSADVDVSMLEKTSDGGYQIKARCTGTFFSQVVNPVASARP